MALKIIRACDAPYSTTKTLPRGNWEAVQLWGHTDIARTLCSWTAARR